MGATQDSDVAFVPKVWSDHIQAYFDRKMALGQLALVDKTLMGAPGEKVTFPYFKAIGDAQEPAQDEGLEVEPLQDDSFDCTVKEIGKAVGWKDKARRKSAANGSGINPNSKQEAEAQRQIARVFAEKVDADIITEINSSGKHEDGFIGTTASTHNASINYLLESKITAFGDKQDDAVAVAMHSQDFLNLMTNSTSGFLKADAQDPFWGAPGFIGRILGMALFVMDTMPAVSGGINSKKAWYHFIFKANPFGLYIAEDLNPEQDRDILHRETIVSATMWYGVLSLNAKVSSSDKRVCRGAFTTSISV
jgi:hypothetical protein